MATTSESATLQYRLNLSNALYSISPALSALHVSRAAALHPEISAVLRPSHCPKCGTYRFSGDSPSKRKRRKRSTSLPPSLLKCHLCGFSIDTVACSTSPPQPVINPVPSLGDLPRTSTAATNETAQGSPCTNTTTSTLVPPSRDRQSRPKSHAKTSSMKEMLSRDRKREEGKRAHDKRKEGHEGLAAFLKQL